ncbi:MAG: hypothetical protein D6729_00410 [Deltaproteobacteria bacterium]|nr:MAG: hypothetical protein D6729_00410 [Deltaproteobacteria bacterium]
MSRVCRPPRWVHLRVLVPCVLALLAGATPANASEVDRIEAEIKRAEQLFADWQYEEAIAIAEALYNEHPTLPPVQYLAGKAKFYRQDYQGAVDLLTRATAASPDAGRDDPFLRYARDTLRITRDYVSEQSEHFELRVPPGPNEVLFPYGLEALEQAWQRIGDDFGLHPAHRIVVEAYSSAEDLSHASGLPVDAIKTSGTIAICKHNKLMFTTPKALLRGYEWLDTLAHEYVHYVVSVKSHNTVPIWLHEGLAKYEETRWRGKAGQALSPYAEKLLGQAIHGKRRFITFEEMHPSMALLPSQEHTALAFAEVFTAVEYLITERGGYPAIRRILELLRDGEDVPQAFAEVLGESFTAFQKGWRAWLKRRPMRMLAAAQAEKLTFKTDVKGKVAESAEDEQDASSALEHPQAKRHAHLGELLRMRGRHLAAAVEYEKAYAAVGPRAPLLSNKLALTYMALKRWDRAEEVLKEALGPNPGFVTTHVHLGRLYLLTGRDDAAEAAFLRANRINPFDPEIHASLHAIYKKRGDSARAEREAKAFARLQAPPRPGRAAPATGEVGFLTLLTRPWARVRIDGKRTGLTTPIFRHPLPAGEHEVVLENEASGVRKRLKVAIEAGEETKRTEVLDSR